MDADKMLKEKTRWELQKNAVSYLEQIQEATLRKTAAVQPLVSHFKDHPRKTNKTCGALLEKKGQTHVMFFYGPLHGHLLPISQTIQLKRTRHVQGHCWRSKDKLISDVFQ